MKLMKVLKVMPLFILLMGLSTGYAQVKKTKYVLTDTKKLEASPVRDQCRTGTCWCFSSSSFIESELLRSGKGAYEISEMFTVRKAYEEKAKQYVMMHGHVNFGEGGEFHDVMRIFKEYGAVPKEAYPGKPAYDNIYTQNELEAVLKGMLDAVIANHDGQLNPNWFEAVNGVLDAYLGKVPEKFNYNGKEYTPMTFAKSLGIDPDDYVELTSTTAHPFYSKFVNEIEDNWHWDEINNVPLSDLQEILGNSINEGYTVAWGGDVSEPGFAYKMGIAVNPDVHWDTIARDKRDTFLIWPMKQKVVTQEIRQQGLDNYATTDDHGMQITGTATDQLGDKFYLVKNSWGSKLNDFNGYFYASESYVLEKTTSIMVNKKTIPKDIAKKLAIK